MHSVFDNMLSKYSLDISEEMKVLVVEQMIATYNQLNEQRVDDSAKIEGQLRELSKKMERLEVRYIEEEINKDMFDKYRLKYREEKKEIEMQLSKIGKKVSNLDQFINSAIVFSSKLSIVWHSSDFARKQLLQFLVFPDGIYYNRKSDECRTQKVNSFFLYMSSLKGVLEKKEKREPQSELYVPSLVARTGVEPVIPP